MALREKLHPMLQRIWDAYPRNARTVRALCITKFKTVNAKLKFTSGDIDEIIRIIDQMKLDRPSWQPRSPYGPQGLQVFLHQGGWDNDYKRVYKPKPRDYGQSQEEEVEWTQEQREASKKAMDRAMERIRHSHETTITFCNYGGSLHHTIRKLGEGL